jgi:hypothetical protein
VNSNGTPTNRTDLVNAGTRLPEPAVRNRWYTNGILEVRLPTEEPDVTGQEIEA